MKICKVRPSCSGTWLVCLTTTELFREIDGLVEEDGAHADIEIRIEEIAPEEIEALPEFGGW